MTDGWAVVFEPGLRILNEEKRHQENDRHELVVGAPPFDSIWSRGLIELDKPPVPKDQQITEAVDQAADLSTATEQE